MYIYIYRLCSSHKPGISLVAWFQDRDVDPSAKQLGEIHGEAAWAPMSCVPGVSGSHASQSPNLEFLRFQIHDEN